MVATLNFGLLQPLDLSQAVQAFDASRGRALQQQNADTQQAQVAAQVAKQQQDADNEIRRKAALKTGARALIYGQFGETPPADAMDMPAAAPTAPMQAAPVSAPAMTPAVAPAGEAVAEPMQTVSAPRVPKIWDELIEEDPEEAIKLFKSYREMGDADRERTAETYGTLAAALIDLPKMPEQERGPALEQMAPMLAARGVPQDMIASVDLSDAGLSALTNQALGLKEAFMVRDRAADNARAETEFAYRQQNDASNRAVTVRGQNMADRRAAQRNGIDAQGNQIKLTEGQGKATGYLRLAEQAESTLSGAGAVVPGEGARIAYGVPFVERLIGGEDRKVLAAQEAFTEASLRFLTGAAVTKDEARRNVSQFFPSPGDTPDVTAQKQAYRQQVMAGMRDAAGPGASRVRVTQPPAPSAPAQGRRNVAGGRLTPTVDGVREWRPGGRP